MAVSDGPEVDPKLKVLFLIPARGGSKGFPGKNVAQLAGVPLVGRAAVIGRDVAADFPGSRVVCSTEDAAIAASAREWGAETPFVRPAELATDRASSIDVVTHALRALDDAFDAVVLLQPTSPLVDADDVRGAIALFASTHAPVVSVCREEHPVEWHHHLGDANRLVPILPKRAEQRQAAEPSYRPNGAVYVASVEQLRNGGFWTPDTRGFVMPVERSIDVDTPMDLAVARAMQVARPARSIVMGGRKIGEGASCFVIAEAGVNHDGSLELALRLVDAAADVGADAVKFQTFKALKLATQFAPKAEYQTRTTDPAESQLDMLKRLELSPDAHRAIIARCAQRGLMFLSSPFDEESADLLESFGVPAFKVSSGELTNLPFLRYLAGKRRPILLSTGMATLQEVQAAVSAVTAAGCRELSLLHCVSNYPAEAAHVNLRAMATMADAFGWPVGYSDHTLGVDVPLAAVALGACIIEKHFTVDRQLPGPDHMASVEPDEFAALVRSIRRVESALGNGEKRPAASELSTALVARRSLVAAMTISRGTRLTADMVVSRRPGTGLAPDRVGELLGRVALADIADGAVLSSEMFT